jgi:hypothetical protein
LIENGSLQSPAGVYAAQLTSTGQALPRRSVCAPQRRLFNDRLFNQEKLIMWFTHLFSQPKQHRNQARVRRIPNASYRNRLLLRLENLEDRTLPSTLTVLNNLDSGAGPLRDAIGKAKSGDMIDFAASLNGQTITLTSDQLTINKNLDIEGPGASLLTISGNDANRVFDISGGLTVTIDGLTITHGLGKGDVQGSNSGGAGGGALQNGGSTVNLANDLFAYNQAGHGGAISNGPGSDLMVVNSTFIDNRAVGAAGAGFVEGGAIWNTDNENNNQAAGAGATAVVIGCTFIGNQAVGPNGGSASGGNFLSECNGGAIHNEGLDFLTVKNTRFISNQSVAGNGGTAKGSSTGTIGVATGGAIGNDDGLHLNVDGCTFSYNKALGGSNATSDSGRLGHAIGGAIATSGGATIANSSFDHNLAQGGSGDTGGSGVVLNGRGAGGAICSFSFAFSFPVTLTVSNCSFTDNRAVGGSGNAGGLVVGTGVGGGIANDRGGMATVTGCTFTGNQAIGGAGASGANGVNGLGGGIANVLGATLTVSGCIFTGNGAIGGAGGASASGGNGLGGGIFNDGPSIFPANLGAPATLTVTGSTVTANSATGGEAGAGGSAGQGVGGGVYFASGGVVCLDLFTSLNIFGNTASTSNNDVFGTFTIC